MTVLHVCVTLLVGVMINLPVVMNADVGKRLENPRVANGIFWIIGAFSAIVIGGHGWVDGTLLKLNAVPIWFLCTGCIGATMLFAIAVLIPRIGAGNFKVMSALGAIMGGLVISHFGLMGTPQSSITPIRVIGAALLALGASMAVRGEDPFHAERRNMRLLPLLAAAALGIVIPLTFTGNAAVGMALGNPRIGNALFEIVGMIVAVLIARGGMSPDMRVRIRRVPLWLWLGGVIAANGVLGMAILIPLLGAGNVQTIIVLAGISSGLVISHYGLLSSPVVRINITRVAGIVIMGFGAALAILGKIPFIDWH